MISEAALTRKSWTVIIPFKGSEKAKSRLSTAHSTVPGIAPELRLRLARAFVHDTVSAALATDTVGRILLVSSDPVIRGELPRARYIADPGLGLNAAIAAATAEAVALDPHSPIAVLTSDLPSLQSTDLKAALAMAEHYPRSVVADHLAIGTTMITGLAGEELTPRFGGPSHELHQRAGHHSLQIPISSTLRQDVDTPRDLRWALGLGVGAATAAVLKTLGPARTIGHSLFGLERNP